MLKSVHENLQQLVFDEDKIVTYKLLTKLLQINVNAAKKYLQDFYDLNHNDLNAFYILVGVQKDENEQQVTKIVVVPSTEFEETKKSFFRVRSSHIYSIHKGQLVDKSALFSADCEGETCNQGLNEYSSIRNPQNVCIESPKKRIKGATAPVIKQEKSLPPPVNKKKVEEKKSSDSSPVHEKKSTSPPEKKLVKGDEGSKDTNSKYKNSNIFSMFQKQQNVKKVGAQKESKNGADVVVLDTKSNRKEENLSVQSEQREKKDIRNLFSKQTDKGAQLLPEQNNDVKPPTVNASNKRSQSSRSGTKQKRLSNKHKKKNDSDSDENMKPQKKKHRRIVELEDSESESENEEMMDKAQRELVHCEPDVSTVLTAGASTVNQNLSEDDDCIPPTPVAGGKKKKWKMISKTFTDENGFFVTKKTKEYVTDSEESGNEQKESKAPAADNEPAKKPSFANKKQASLMSFFRQK